MEHEERLFLETLEDIQEKLSRNSEYSLIRASGLLRQLFVDDHPLLHQVNRRHRVKIEFETIDYTMKIPIRPDIHWLNLDASAFPNARTIKSNLRSFLSAECLIYQQHDFNVRDIIKACANIMGGVHSGTAKSEKEKAFLDLGRVFRIHGSASSLAALAGIAQVSLVGLYPLRDSVKAALTNEQA